MNDLSKLTRDELEYMLTATISLGLDGVEFTIDDLDGELAGYRAKQAGHACECGGFNEYCGG